MPSVTDDAVGHMLNFLFVVYPILLQRVLFNGMVELVSARVLALVLLALVSCLACPLARVPCRMGAATTVDSVLNLSLQLFIS